MPNIPTTPQQPNTIGTSALKPVVNRYYRGLKEFEGKADYELALRSAFQNLLADTARMMSWTLIPEQTIEGNIRPDGVLRDTFNLKRGFWEAKGPKSDLEKEIQNKITHGYPLINTVFENTKKAVLYQNKKRAAEYDLQNFNDVCYLLRDFFSYTEPDIATFESAVQEFKNSIPELASALLAIIEKEHKLNKKFISAFAIFADLCRSSLNPQINTGTINEMLVQHLLTKRLFRTVFGNSEFTSRNIIAAEIEKVVTALTSRVFNPDDFLKNLDRFYVAIERAAKGIESWGERQEFLNTVYERFFQGFSIKQADTHGIVYTPQEIVDFMVESIDEVLKREFGKSIDTPGVQILDPATGTGNFIVNLIRRIDDSYLEKKYKNDLFCNEIMLLPYYISSLNIEHEYYVKMGQYEPFEGVCFADTLELAEGQQMTLEMFVEENTERVKREKNADIMVVIGNPPYNTGQRNENDNNKNRAHPIIDARIRNTYGKDSRASNTNKLYDAYVKFFRWASDRLENRDGIVCFVSNNGFLNGIAFDGFRKHLLKDFDLIYHLDLKGNARTSGERRRREGGNIFDDKIRTGIGITLLVRSKHIKDKSVLYHCVGDYWPSKQKRKYLHSFGSIINVPWQPLNVDANNNWLVNNLTQDFTSFLPLGAKEAKSASVTNSQTVFKLYSLGVNTNRDDWVYDFNQDNLVIKIEKMIDTYSTELYRWVKAGAPKNIDDFVTNDDTKIKWSSRLKECFARRIEVNFNKDSIRDSLYRPFTREFLYFDKVLNHRQGQFPLIFPTPQTETENRVICLSGIGSSKPFHCLASNVIPCLDLLEKTQCFPFYIYTMDGNNRRENVTDWILKQFQEKYGVEVSKWNIFHYVYGILHHPQYRELYKEDLKLNLPHIPLLLNHKDFEICVSIGKQLMDLHINYEKAEEYPLRHVSDKNIPYIQRLHLEKMKLSTDKKSLNYSKGLTLEGIPQVCFEYRLGNRSALEWVIDQHQVSTDKRSGIESDPNRLDDPEYIVRLVKQVITVSVKTVELVKELTESVTAEAWLGESIDMSEGLLSTDVSIQD